MPAPPLIPAQRYFPPGIRAMVWVVTIANYLVPTRAEINSGTDLTGQVMSLNGWSLQGSMIDVPDLGSGFTSQINGRLTSPTNDITCYLSQNSIDVRGLLPRLTNGYMLGMWEGDVPGNKMDVFPARVVTQAVDTAVEDPGQVTISFAVTRVPATNLTIPA